MQQKMSPRYSRKLRDGNECQSCEFELKKDLALSDEIYSQAFELNAEVYGEAS